MIKAARTKKGSLSEDVAPTETGARLPIQNITGTWGRRDFAAVLLTFSVILMYCGQAAPDVNESHYLTKAKYFWNPDWCADDLFLSSPSAHVLFFTLFGWMTHFVSLEAFAWIGRVIVWVGMAFAWTRWLRRHHVRPAVIPIAMALWLVLIERGNLAGEWVVGGFEAKSVAFVCLMFALSFFAERRDTVAWVCVGWAIAFHFLVGIWFLIAWALSQIICLVVKTGRGECAWRGGMADLVGGWNSPMRNLASLGVLVFVILAIGVGAIPSLWADYGVEPEVTLTAAQIQVEHRLAHHQYFGAFATKRIAAFVVLLLFWSLCSIWTLKSHAQTQVYFFSVGSLFLALVGLLLSAIAESGGEFGDMAFRLLRLYWFRLADFAVPSVIVLTLATLLSRAEVWKGTRGRIIGFSFGILILAMCLAIYERHRDARPRADQASLWSFSEERKTNDVYRNWRAVCEWIKTNTPNDAVFITPADQQTFKWYAHRAEVVSWKDMPQDAQSIVEWWNRVKQVLQPQRNYDGGLMAYTDADLLALGQYYRADYLLIPQRDLERRQSGTELRQLYPTDPTRRVTYVVLEIPKVPLK